MKVEETVEYMSKMYLERIIKSFTSDYPSNKDESEYREIIKNNIKILADPSNIKNKVEAYLISNHKDPYANKLLYFFVLRAILASPDFACNEDEICNIVEQEEKQILELSTHPESFRHVDDKSIDIFKVVLDAAFEDEVISSDELALIGRLRKKLGISEKDQYLIQASMSLFPSKRNELHGRSQILKGIEDLQKCGIIFYCNRQDDSNKVLTLPVELVDGVKEFLGIELIDDKYELLLGRLNNDSLRNILSARNIHKYGTKEELVERIIHSGIKPSEALQTIKSSELSDVLSKIPSLNKTGTKDDKIQRLISYFSRLVIKDATTGDIRRKYYEYLEELAKRDMDNLLGNNVIKDRDYVDKAFEDGTTYLFENKFNIPTLDFEGNEHADGAVIFSQSDNILLWDNKSRKNGEPYKFPDNHFRQFRRYIRNERDSGRRVSCFLIISSEIDESAEKNAYRLKAESGVDTDVALITASNLKYLAENWHKHSSHESFNLHVLNRTGILEIETLKKQMKYLG